MTIETEVANLTAQTTALLNAVNVSKSVLDQKVTAATTQAALATTNGATQVALATAQVGNAATSAAAANTKAGEAAGSASQALAIYGSTAAIDSKLNTALTQVALAAGYAASAGSAVQQDLSAISAALHRSPNAVTAMTVYDTSKDSDGGAWRKRMHDKSWMNEPLAGKWLGAVATEAAARAISGATTNDYFQLTTDGKFYKLNASAGIAEVFRGNKAEFPALSAVIAEAGSVTIYDLTEPGRPMWRRFTQNSRTDFRDFWRGNRDASCIAASNGKVIWGLAGISSDRGVCLVDFAADKLARFGGSQTGVIGGVTLATTVPLIPATMPVIANDAVNAVAMTVLDNAPIDPVTAIQSPLTATFTAGGVSLIKPDGAVVNSASTAAATKGYIDKDIVMWSTATGILWARNPGALTAGFAATAYNTTTFPAQLALPTSVSGAKVKVTGSASGITLLRDNPTTTGSGLAAYVASTFNSGWQVGDIKRCLLADTGAGVVSGPATIPDRSYKNKPLSIIGSLTKTEVATAAQLVAYSGFSAANYGREDYSADLDLGTAAWSASAWVNYATAVASVIFDRAAATGSRITLGTDAMGKLTATAFDGTTTRTVTSPATYNNGAWLKARIEYTVDGALALKVNGVEVAKTTGAPLLTLNNANAVLTVGNNFALNAPFPGSLALVKASATVPTLEQSQWMYAQEKQMFQEGAQVCLPDAGAVVDLAYDELTDRWTSVSATNEASFTGLVRTRTSAVSAGSYTKIAKQSGVRMTARSTTTPGVDIVMPAYGLREELVRRNEAAAAASRPLLPFNFDAIAAQTDFVLDAGYTAVEAMNAGASKREGATKDWVRLFDGFRETVRFAVAPGAAVWVQIIARKA